MLLIIFYHAKNNHFICIACTFEIHQTTTIASRAKLEPSIQSPRILPAYSASSGACGGVSSTCTPPLFFSLLSWNGNLQPPSSSGVLNQSLIKCLLGIGGK